MEDTTKLSRRQLLRLTYNGVRTAAVGAVLAACGGQTPSPEQPALPTAVLAPGQRVPAPTAAEAPGATAAPNLTEVQIPHLDLEKLQGTERVISLQERQKEALRNRINQDPDAQKIFAAVQRNVEKALTTPPKPLAEIHSSGGYPDAERTAANEALKDADMAYQLAIAGVVTQDQGYVDTTKEYVLAWARTNHSLGHPIDDSRLDRLWLAYDLTKDAFSEEEQGEVLGWVDQVATAQLNHPLEGNTAINNWVAHRDKLVLMAGVMTGKQEYVDAAEASYEHLMATYFNPDGTTFEAEDHDALAYHTYGLEPAIEGARILAINGAGNIYSLENSKGGSLQKSIEYLRPYARREQTHNDFENSRVSGDSGREGIWDPKTARRVLEDASYFDPTVIADLNSALEIEQTPYPTIYSLLYAVQRDTP